MGSNWKTWNLETKTTGLQEEFITQRKKFEGMGLE